MGSFPSSKWKEGGARELVEKERIIWGRGHLFFGGREGRRFLCRLPLLWWMERAYLTSYLMVLEQKIPYWGIKVLVLREVETVVRSGIQSEFGIMDF